MCSLPSANGPSVRSTSPPWSRITVAVLAGCNPPLKTQAPALFISWVTASTSRITFARNSAGGGSPSGWITLSRYCFTVILLDAIAGVGPTFHLLYKRLLAKSQRFSFYGTPTHGTSAG